MILTKKENVIAPNFNGNFNSYFNGKVYENFGAHLKKSVDKEVSTDLWLSKEFPLKFT